MPCSGYVWAVVGTRGGDRLVLDSAPTREAAEALRERYAAHLEGYERLAVEYLGREGWSSTRKGV